MKTNLQKQQLKRLLPTGSKSIESKTVHDYVLERISFPLPYFYWVRINSHFAHIWNTELGIGTAFYWDEIADTMYRRLQGDKILLSRERTERIINLMLCCIEENGGFQV